MHTYVIHTYIHIYIYITYVHNTYIYTYIRTIPYYTIPYHAILYCTILYCTVLYYTILHYTILYYTILRFLIWSGVSSVTIVTTWRAEHPKHPCDSWQASRYFAPVHSIQTSCLAQWVRRLKRPERETYHSPASSLEVKDACRFTSTPSCSWCCV